VIIGVTAFGVVYGGYKTVKWVQNRPNAKANKNEITDTNAELNTLTKSGVMPTYAPAQYATWASTLKTALSGTGDGWTTQVPIWSGMKNDADITELITAYGTKTIPGSWLFSSDFTGNLAATLAYKYSGFEASVETGSLAKINAILNANGLTFQF
jgi:hypothetical protein